MRAKNDVGAPRLTTMGKGEKPIAGDQWKCRAAGRCYRICACRIHRAPSMASSVCGFWNRTVLRVDPRQDMMETLAELPGFTRQRQP